MRSSPGFARNAPPAALRRDSDGYEQYSALRQDSRAESRELGITQFPDYDTEPPVVSVVEPVMAYAMIRELKWCVDEGGWKVSLFPARWACLPARFGFKIFHNGPGVRSAGSAYEKEHRYANECERQADVEVLGGAL
jgi:hypothetical protein